MHALCPHRIRGTVVTECHTIKLQSLVYIRSHRHESPSDVSNCMCWVMVSVPEIWSVPVTKPRCHHHNCVYLADPLRLLHAAHVCSVSDQCFNNACVQVDKVGERWQSCVVSMWLLHQGVCHRILVATCRPEIRCQR